jgi:aminomethyltransferase
MSTNTGPAKRTPLYDWHKAQGAKFTPFAGWEMPVQYKSIVQEHNAVRNTVGVFDISHMGQVFAEGPDTLAFLQKICTNDLSKCAPGKAQYSHLCNEAGGVIDDIFVYCFDATHYLIVVNASTSDKDFAWMEKHKTPGLKLANRSNALSMIAVQGPKAEAALSKLFKALPARHRVAVEQWKGRELYLCRTGYTGEDGFELIAPNETILSLLEAAMEAGQPFGIQPCGLGARDTLRLEAGYLLYGNDVDDDHTPLEAGVPWVVKFEKGDFIGRAALLKQKEAGVPRKLTGFKLKERGIPRHGSKILCDGREIGEVSSGTFSPSLQVGIAMGYVPSGTQGAFAIECNGRPVPVEIVTPPFYSGSKS